MSELYPVTLISRIFNRSRNYFNENFLTRKPCARASMDTGLCCQIRKGCSPKRYLRSKHCFAESCELERGPRPYLVLRASRIFLYVPLTPPTGNKEKYGWLARLGHISLYATPMLHYVAACAWFRQRSSRNYFKEKLSFAKI